MLHRKARVPVADALGLRDAGEVRHQRAVGPRHLHRHDGADAEAVRGLGERRAGVGQKVGQLQLSAGLELQLVREPLVDDDLVIAQVRRHERRTGGSDHRVGGGVGARAQQRGEVSEDGLRGGVHRPRGADGGRVEEDAVGAEFEGRRVGEESEVELCVLKVPVGGKKFVRKRRCILFLQLHGRRRILQLGGQLHGPRRGREIRPARGHRPFLKQA